MPKKLTNKEYIERCIEKHGHTYNYNQTNYVNKTTAIQFFCKIHGLVSQPPMNHLKRGCKHCSRGSDNTYSFTHKAKKAGHNYDYSITEFTSNKKKIKFICPKHGEQEQYPKYHLENGCSECAGIPQPISKHTPESVLKKFRKTHGNKYSYPDLTFDTIHDKIKIECPIHGKFDQQIWAHINGQGCRICGYANRNVYKKTTKEFIAESKEKYGDFCDYSKVNLDNCTTHDPINIICPKHGEFTTTAHLHLNQCVYPCPACARESSSSVREKEVFDFIASLYKGNIIRHDRQALKGREIDIYLPDIKFGIEYHGLYYHTEKRVGKKHHLVKANLADKYGIYLLQIFEHEWNDKTKSIIKAVLGKNIKIYARNTEVVELSDRDKNEFLDKNHLQGAGRSRIKLGLIHNGEIVSCMTFGKPRFNDKFDWEIIRYCSLMGTSVVGGASKLFKHFAKHYLNEGKVISYVNRRWFTGSIYENMKFECIGRSEIGFFYYSPSGGILSRYQCQKYKIKDIKGYSEDKSGYKIMKENGYDRVWDAGNLVFAYG